MTCRGAHNFEVWARVLADFSCFEPDNLLHQKSCIVALWYVILHVSVNITLWANFNYINSPKQKTSNINKKN